MSTKVVLSTLKHIESDASGIAGFEGPHQTLAKELMSKIRALIDFLEGKPEDAVVAATPPSEPVATEDVAEAPVEETTTEAEAVESKTK